MGLFYSENLSSQNKQVLLGEEEGRHLQNVLRKKQGDSIQITNGKGLLAEALIVAGKTKSLVCDVQSLRHMPSPPERNIHIALSTIRPNRLDWAVEKLTELGVGSISFFHSQFTSVRAFKADHLRKIAISAMKQSRQCFLPDINTPLPFSNWLQSLPKKGSQVRLLAHLEESSKDPRQVKWGEKSLVIAIGPEGGFSENELTLATENKFVTVKIDNHILRTETAAVTAASQVKLLMRK